MSSAIASSNPWSIVVGSLIALMTSAGAIMAFTFSLFIAPLTEEFQWSRATISLGFSVMTLALAISAPLMGRLMDRVGTKKVLLIAIPLFALTFLAASFIPASVPLFLVCFALAGVLGAAHSPIPYVKLVSLWFDRNRGLALGITMMGIGLGGAVLSKSLGVIIAEQGWRAGFVGIAVAIVALAIPAVAFLLREPAKTTSGETPNSIALTNAVGKSSSEVLRDSRFWSILVFVFLLTMALNGIAAHVVPFLELGGIERTTAASLLGALAGASLLGRLLTGFILDRVFAPLIAGVICIFGLIGLCILGFGGGTVPAAIAGLIFLGFALGAETDIMGFLIGRYFGMKSFGEIIGYTFATFSLASAVGAPLMGLAYDLNGNYDHALITFGLGLIVSTVVIVRLGKYEYPMVGH